MCIRLSAEPRNIRHRFFSIMEALLIGEEDCSVGIFCGSSLKWVYFAAAESLSAQCMGISLPGEQQPYRSSSGKECTVANSTEPKYILSIVHCYRMMCAPNVAKRARRVGFNSRSIPGSTATALLQFHIFKDECRLGHEAGGIHAYPVGYYHQKSLQGHVWQERQYSTPGEECHGTYSGSSCAMG